MMRIGWVHDPLNWDRWPEAEALLQPAQRVDPNCGEILDFNHLLWAVMDGDELLAAATARLTEDRECEVVLVGGRDHKRWLKGLDEMIGAAARDAGALRLVACGRAGWRKALKALGWESEGAGDLTIYSRALEGCLGQEEKE